MTDKTVTVTLTEDEARQVADWLNPAASHSSTALTVIRRLRQALPPEWEEGTVAWVTNGMGRCIARREGGEWATDWSRDGSPAQSSTDDEVTKVEPLRVLGDDEVAVKVGRVDSWHIRRDVESDTLRPTCSVGSWLLEVANTLDAEEARNA